jgi:hypothetical protein
MTRSTTHVGMHVPGWSPMEMGAAMRALEQEVEELVPVVHGNRQALGRCCGGYAGTGTPYMPFSFDLTGSFLDSHVWPRGRGIGACLLLHSHDGMHVLPTPTR